MIDSNYYVGIVDEYHNVDNLYSNDYKLVPVVNADSGTNTEGVSIKTLDFLIGDHMLLYFNIGAISAHHYARVKVLHVSKYYENFTML